MRTKLLVAALVLASASVGRAEDGLTKGTPEVKSITSMAFGPNGVLFLGDAAGATIFAVNTGDTKATGNKELNIEKLDAKIAETLGGGPVRITDVKVNPASGNVFVSVARGAGNGTPAATASASWTSESSAPWRTSPVTTPRSHTCSAGVAAPKSSSASAARAICEPDPDSRDIRSNASCASPTVSDASAAGEGSVVSERHPSPVRRCSSEPLR